MAGTGPRNLPKRSPLSVRSRSPRASRVRSMPRMRSAGTGYGPPPGGGGGGSPKSTSPMSTPPRGMINRPKTGRARRGLGKPHADFPSRI